MRHIGEEALKQRYNDCYSGGEYPCVVQVETAFSQQQRQTQAWVEAEAGQRRDHFCAALRSVVVAARHLNGMERPLPGAVDGAPARAAGAVLLLGLAAGVGWRASVDRP